MDGLKVRFMVDKAFLIYVWALQVLKVLGDLQMIKKPNSIYLPERVEGGLMQGSTFVTNICAKMKASMFAYVSDTKKRFPNIYIHTYRHTYIYYYIHTYIHTFIHICPHTHYHTNKTHMMYDGCGGTDGIILFLDACSMVRCWIPTNFVSSLLGKGKGLAHIDVSLRSLLHLCLFLHPFPHTHAFPTSHHLSFYE
jgi:hypothetical protein